MRAWLSKVLRSRAVERFRSDARRRQREREAQGVEPLPSPDELANRLELQRDLVEFILGLPEPYRSAIVLRYHDGVAAADIARRKGVPAGTVRSHISGGMSRDLRGEDPGSPASAWTAKIEYDRDHAYRVERGVTTLDADGEFSLRTRWLGKYVLEIESPQKEGFEIRAEIEVRPGANSLVLDLETAPVTLENLPAQEHVYLLVEDPSGASVRRRLDPAGEGVVEVYAFPVGAVSVVHCTAGIWWPEYFQTLATAYHAAGETTHIVVPGEN